MSDEVLLSEKSGLVCPKCGSRNVSVQVVEKQKKMGCFASLMWILLAVTIVGLILLLIPALSRKGSKTLTFAVCQNCGHRWKV